MGLVCGRGMSVNVRFTRGECEGNAVSACGRFYTVVAITFVREHGELQNNKSISLIGTQLLFSWTAGVPERPPTQLYGSLTCSTEESIASMGSRIAAVPTMCT